MSKEFEEIVLEKLEALDKKTTNTDKVIQEVVLKKLEKLDALDERTKNTDKVIEEVILKKLDTLEVKFDNLETEVGSLKAEVKDTNENVKDLNNRFTVFDFEINKKIDTLFDAITANDEKHEVFEKSIVSLNTKTFNHDIRISVLEDYSKNAKLFAMN